jgi:hypothetical protein
LENFIVATLFGISETEMLLTFKTGNEGEVDV